MGIARGGLAWVREIEVYYSGREYVGLMICSIWFKSLGKNDRFLVRMIVFLEKMIVVFGEKSCF